MIKINLLAEGKRPTAVRRARPSGGLRDVDMGQVLLVGALLLCVLGGAVYWWLLYSEIQSKQAAIRAAEREYRELEPIIQEVNDYKAKKQELETKIQIINELKANQTGPVRIMDEISRAVPELLWLTSLAMRNNQVTLQGRAFNTNAVATFTDNLDKVPEFQEPYLQEAKLSRGDVYDFSIEFEFQITPEGEVPAEGEAQEPGTPTAGAGG